MKRFLLSLAIVALMGGCSSAVKLDDVQVVDRSGTVLQPHANSGGETTGVNGTGVAPVDLSQSSSPTVAPEGPRVVYFDHDSFVIKPEFLGLLDAHARFIKSSPNRNAALEGHTDDTGGREYNLALGQKRAEAVRSALALLGVSDARMEAVSFGKEKPAANGTDEASRAMNRRVEISYR